MGNLILSSVRFFFERLLEFWQSYPTIRGETALCGYYRELNRDVPVAFCIYAAANVVAQVVGYVIFVHASLPKLMAGFVLFDVVHLVIISYSLHLRNEALKPENLKNFAVQRDIMYRARRCIWVLVLFQLVSGYKLMENEAKPAEETWLSLFLLGLYVSLWSGISLGSKVLQLTITNVILCIFAKMKGQFQKEFPAHILMPLIFSTALIAAYDRERKQNFILKQLMKSRRKNYKQFLRLLLQPVVIVGKDGVLFANPAAADTLGGENNEKFHKAASGIVLVGDERQSLEDCVKARLRYPEISPDAIKQERYRVRDETDPHKEKIVVMTLIESSFFSREKTVALVMHDITAELVQEEKRVEDKYKNMMLFSLSHELRTPLNILQSTIALARRVERNSADHECYRNGKGAWHYLRNKINDMLTYAQLLMGEFVLHEESFSLTKFMKYLHKITTFLLHEKKDSIKLMFVTSPYLNEHFTCDKERLEQVLFNLLRNAVKHTSAGSISLKVSSDRGKLIFEIADTGSGLPQDVANYILNKGSADRSRRSTENLHKGKLCGLGLTVSQIICNKMGGEMTVTSAPDRGTCFTLAIPSLKTTSEGLGMLSDRVIPSENCVVNSCTNPTMGPSEAHCRRPPLINLTSKDPDRESSISVLIVDDSAFNRLVAHQMVGKYKFHIEEAENGKVAIDRFQTIHSISTGTVLILMDLDMPVMTGIEATKAIRKLSMRPRPYICALTAFASESERNSCMSAGMDWFLSKPLTKEGLSALLERVRIPFN
ncbi:MAG: ATP-binding protein [Acidobacteriaceae bacterium]|nr:ATP-binding protein [Acidobacteriaceae bacterium]